MKKDMDMLMDFSKDFFMYEGSFLSFFIFAGTGNTGHVWHCSICDID